MRACTSELVVGAVKATTVFVLVACRRSTECRGRSGGAEQAQLMLINFGDPVRCSLMKGTMNALFIKFSRSGTAARGYTC